MRENDHQQTMSEVTEVRDFVATELLIHVNTQREGYIESLGGDHEVIPMIITLKGGLDFVNLGSWTTRWQRRDHEKNKWSINNRKKNREDPLFKNKVSCSRFALPFMTWFCFFATLLESSACSIESKNIKTREWDSQHQWFKGMTLSCLFHCLFALHWSLWYLFFILRLSSRRSYLVVVASMRTTMTVNGCIFLSPVFLVNSLS